MLETGNLLISAAAFATLLFTIIKVRKPFKQHSFNTFAYIILLLLVYSLIGKNHSDLHSIVRSFFFFVDKDGISPKLKGFVATYPAINLVICSYLLSNQW